jgi:hypothetical protein
MFNSSTTLLRFENSEWKDDDKWNAFKRLVSSDWENTEGIWFELWVNDWQNYHEPDDDPARGEYNSHQAGFVLWWQATPTIGEANPDRNVPRHIDFETNFKYDPFESDPRDTDAYIKILSDRYTFTSNIKNHPVQSDNTIRFTVKQQSHW